MLAASLPLAGEDRGNEQAPTVEAWTDSRIRAVSYQREKLSEAIFDLLDNVTLIQQHFGPGGAGSAQVTAGRRVYDNHDAVGSYTVVDHFRTHLAYPLLTAQTPFIGNLTLGFSITGRSGLDFTDIRQVLPNEYARLESVGQRLAQMRRTGWGKELDAAVATAPPGPTNEEEPLPTDSLEEWVFADRERQAKLHPQAFEGLGEARYSRLHNIVTFPWRLPLKAEWVSRLDDGEIISYTAQGAVEVGPSISTLLDLGNLSATVDTSLSFTAFIAGDFRVSILRESARYVQVKITREGSIGQRISLGSSSTDYISGVALIERYESNSSIALLPFAFDASRSAGRSFDLVYRYDLSTAAGRSAYDQAVLGRFGLSDRIAGGTAWRQMPADSPVCKLATRDTRFETTRGSTETRFGILYRHGNSTKLTFSDVVTTSAEGKTRLYRSEADDSRFWRFLWGTYERVNHTFRFDVDRDRLARGDALATSLVVEAEIIDTDTDGVELRQYIDELETLANRPQFFPRAPVYRPLTMPSTHPANDDDRRRSPATVDRLRPIDYGRSTFYYRALFDGRQLLAFVATPEADMWRALEQAFGVAPGCWSTRWSRATYYFMHLGQTLLDLPFTLINVRLESGFILSHASAIHDQWSAAQLTKDPIERLRRLGRMFSDRYYAPQLVRLLRARLAGEKVPFVIQGTSHAFGTMRDESIGTVKTEPPGERERRLIDIDRVGPRTRSDDHERLTDIAVKPIDDDHFTLHLTVPPETRVGALFVRLIEQRPWHLPREIGEAVYIDRRLVFTPGRKSIDIDRTSGFLASLFAQVEPGNRYQLQLSCTRDGLLWGQPASCQFEPPLRGGVEPRPPPRPRLHLPDLPPAFTGGESGPARLRLDEHGAKHDRRR